jgi:endo-1,4-beta-xylanase
MERSMKYKSICAASVIFFTVFIVSQSRAFGQTEERPEKEFIGNIIGRTIPADFQTYWNQATPENAGKWGDVEIKNGEYMWDTLDMIYAYSVKNNLPFKFHNLVWGKQQPKWITELPEEEQALKVEQWIKLCAGRYPKTQFVDVVNEPIRTAKDTFYPPYYKTIGGKGKTGWDWVIWSFEKARRYFPDAKLILNEYNMLNGKRAVDTLIKIAGLLKERNLVDAIGIQGHFCEETDTSIIKANLKRIVDIGLPIYISEYDVNIADDEKQLEVYKQQFPIFIQCKAIKGITLWGYVQNEIWRTDAYLVRTDGTERPALKWLKQYLKK